jgi:acyl-CoA synthetase (AMP-forming)/AMP-acid ligase II
MFVDRVAGPLAEPHTGRHWSADVVHAEFARRVRHLRQHGLQPDDRVFLHYGNTIEFFVDLLAIWALGGCAIPLDTRLTAFEVETLARAARPRFSLWNGSPDEALVGPLSTLGTTMVETLSGHDNGDADPVSLDPSALTLDRAALILFTSGTTGDPKGVVHTHRSLRARWTTLGQALGLDAYRNTLCLLPTHFGHGLICNCLFPWLNGQHLHILPPFRAETLVRLGTILDEHRISFMSSVPSVWRIALKAARPPQAGTLRRVSIGSAPLTAAMWRDVQAWTGTKDVLNTYGITETGSWVAGTTVPDFTPEDGLIGFPWGAVVKILPHADTGTPPALATECRIGEEGYVWLNTPALMRGYFERDDLTRQVVSQGWFMTGDVGVMDERGALYLRGRIREEINKGGMKVQPADVDAVVERFIGVKDVCCFAIDDPVYGQDVGIAVVLEDTSAERIMALLDWTRAHLAVHKVPVRWYAVDAIPRTSRGKINRTNVAAECAARNAIDLPALRRGGA